MNQGELKVNGAICASFTYFFDRLMFLRCFCDQGTQQES